MLQNRKCAETPRQLAYGKEFIVPLDIYSDSLSLGELTSALGRDGDKTAHDKAAINHRGQPFGEALWTLESRRPGNLSIEEHIANLAVQYALHAITACCRVTVMSF